MKKLLIYILSIIVLIVFVVSSSLFVKYKNDSRDKSVKIEDGKIVSNELVSNDFQSKYSSPYKLDDMPVSMAKNINISLLDSDLPSDTNVLLRAQRYYVPVNTICKKLGYIVDSAQTNLILKNNENTILISNTSFSTDAKSGTLRGNLLNYQDQYYISISDIEQIFNLISVFDFKGKKISFYNYNYSKPKTTDLANYTDISLLRFEDLSSGSSYNSDTNQAKVKVLANYLYGQGIKYHLSWIPRFIDPSNNIDKDLLTSSDIETVGFVNMLDFLIDHNGQVGLHGYTHQFADSESGIGPEITPTVNSTVAQERKVIENAIDVASALNIPVTYFETPHYAENAKQKELLEDYFQYIYEPYDQKNENNLYNSGKSLYIPTPIGYIHEGDPSPVIDVLNADSKVLNSFFYHLYLEMPSIDYSIDKNNFIMNYNENSPLHQVVNKLDEQKIATVHIDELKK